MKKKYSYDGPIWLEKMPKEVRRAYSSWSNQRSKCNSKKNPDYKYYGGKGIRVEYDSSEFIGWWLDNIKKRKWKDPTVGRIDHDKNYCFENIEMQERSDNSMERYVRHGVVFDCSKPVLALKDGKIIKRFKSASAAADHFDKPNSTIVRICNGQLNKIRSGHTFMYEE